MFGWTFTPGGWPEFFHIDTGIEEPGHPVGSLQKRRAIAEGRPIYGFEATIAVPDVGAAMDAAVAAGGKVLMEPTSILGVGTLVFIEDTEGNIVGAMRYDQVP